MDIQQLRYFKEVAQIGKISDAADALFISAPALSMAIARLEKELGVQLFDRTNNRIILNRQGEIFLHFAKRTLAELDYTKRELHQSLAKGRKHVSFACVVATQWVDLIAAFTQEHPDFSMSCIPVGVSNVADGLPTQVNLLLAAEEDVDAALNTELESAVLFEEYPFVMVHKDHPFADQDTVQIKQLCDENLFLPMPGDSLCRYLNQLFADEEILLPLENCYSYLTAQQMVSKGLGVAFATSRFVRDKTLDICYIPLESASRRWIFRLYWRKSRTLTDDEAVMKEFVEKYYTKR